MATAPCEPKDVEMVHQAQHCDADRETESRMHDVRNPCKNTETCPNDAPDHVTNPAGGKLDRNNGTTVERWRCPPRHLILVTVSILSVFFLGFVALPSEHLLALRKHASKHTLLLRADGGRSSRERWKNLYSAQNIRKDEEEDGDNDQNQDDQDDGDDNDADNNGEENNEADNEADDQQEDQNNNDADENDQQEEEEGNEDNEKEDEEEDGENNADQDAEEDDQEGNENDDAQARQYDEDGEGDDFFGEDLADDYIRDNNIDDFYAFVEGPEPPHLLPLTEREIVGYCIASAALTLGASGGIGGGGIVVPVYLLVMGMSPKVAIPIGAVTVLGGALSSTIINFQRRHPLADRPIIDWDFVLVMQPVVLIGVLFGTFIHQLLSEQILIVLLVVMLSVTAHSTLSKAMRMYEAEKRYIRHLKAAMAEPPSGSPSRTFTWGDGELHTMKPDKAIVDEEEKERILIENPDFVTLRSDLLEEEKFTPNSKILVVVCVISVLITLNIMVGGGGIESPWGIVCGSAAFWTIHTIMICFLMLAAWSAQAHLIARHEIKNIVRFDYVHGDIRWNRRAGWLYPVVFMIAGLLAGMFGIGGGIMIVPLLLTIGTHPAVASSTSSAMVLITSLVSTSTYAVFGLILWDFALLGFFVAFFSSLVGQILMGRLRQARSASGRTFERNSYIAFVIGGVVLISAVLMTIQYIFSIVEGPNDDYGSLCDGLTFNT